MTAHRVLAVAVATGRVGYVFLVGGELCDWGLSRKASANPGNAAKQAKAWIDQLTPDVVVTEKIDQHTRKGLKTKQLIDAIASAAADAYVFDVSVPRTKTHKNKYAEATALAERFPDILPWVPKRRRIWEPEPRNSIYFEALVLALPVIDKRSDSSDAKGG